MSPLKSQNAGQTGLNRLREVQFSTVSRPTFAGQVIRRRTLPHFGGVFGGQATTGARPRGSHAQAVEFGAAMHRQGRSSREPHPTPENGALGVKLRGQTRDGPEVQANRDRIKPTKVKQFVAEGVGFEPTSDFHRCRFSRPVPSTTRPPLRANTYFSVGGAVFNPPRNVGRLSFRGASRAEWSRKRGATDL